MNQVSFAKRAVGTRRQSYSQRFLLTLKFGLPRTNRVNPPSGAMRMARGRGSGWRRKAGPARAEGYVEITAPVAERLSR